MTARFGASNRFYFQLYYAMDRAADLDPETATTPALEAAVNGDLEGVLAQGTEGLLEVISETHSGMSVEDFQADVASWLESATHPETGMAL